MSKQKTKPAPKKAAAKPAPKTVPQPETEGPKTFTAPPDTPPGEQPTGPIQIDKG